MAKIERDPDAIDRAATLGGPSEETREFSIGAILSVTGTVLLADVDEVWDLLDYVAGESVMTHARPTQADGCAPYLRAQCPDLAKVDTTAFSAALRDVPDEHLIVFCKGWLQRLAEEVGGMTRAVAKPRETLHTDPTAGMERLGSGRV